MCRPSPCGPNSRCQEVNKQAVCSCLSDYIGVPPGCHPECVTSAECPREKACINQKCENPCINACGTNAECKVINHSPICTCVSQYTGDPFTRCNPIPRKYYIWNNSSSLTIYYKKLSRVLMHVFIFIYSTGGKFSTRTLQKPMYSIAVWPEFHLSRNKKLPILHLHAKLHWKSSELQT